MLKRRIKELYDELFEEFESFENFALDLCYLYPAIILGNKVDLSTNNELYQALDSIFSVNHWIWSYINVVEED